MDTEHNIAEVGVHAKFRAHCAKPFLLILFLTDYSWAHVVCHTRPYYSIYKYGELALSSGNSILKLYI